MKPENIRAYIVIRFKLGIKANDILSELKTAVPDHAPSLKTVYRWMVNSKKKSVRVEDKPRPGRPITKCTSSNIDQVKVLIDENPNIGYAHIEAQTSLSYGTINKIIHDHLLLKKISARWVPHELSKKNREDRVHHCEYNLAMIDSKKWRLGDINTGDESWFYHRQISKRESNKTWVGEGDCPRELVRQGRFEPKTMFSVFFKRSGLVHLSYLEKGKTINHELYIEECLKPIVKVLKNERPITGAKNIKFHHDNARPHIHKNVFEYLEGEKFVMMPHPPYSPDLAPCDFWLFDYIKDRLGTCKDAKELTRSITKIVSAIDKKEWSKTFDKWVERMRLCISSQGYYFEHLLK